MNAITANLRQLTNFKGRDRRSRFWPYVAFLIAAYFVVSLITMSLVGAMAFTHATDDPGKALSGILVFASVNAAIAVIIVLMLAAAVSRRLHDSGIPGLLGLMPVPFLLFSMAAMPLMVARFDEPEGPTMDLFGAIFASNVIYMLTLVTLIVLLCRRSTKGANRYGEEPAA